MPDVVRQVLLLGAGVAVLCGLGALLPRPRLGAVAALPACAANTLAAVTVAAFAADAAGLSLGAVAAALAVAALLAGIWRLQRARLSRRTKVVADAAGSRHPRVSASPRPRVPARPRLAAGDAACFAVALGAVALALWSGTWFSHGADTFYHLAAARTQVLDGTALPHRIFVPEPVGPDPTSGTWHAVLVLVAWLAAQDVASVWAVLTPLAAGLEVLGFAALGRAASGSGWVGAAGALAYVALERRLDLRTAPFPNEVAWLPLGMALVAALALWQRPAADARTNDTHTSVEERPAPPGESRRHPRPGQSGLQDAQAPSAGLLVAVAAWTAAAAGVHLAYYGLAVMLLAALAVAALALRRLRHAALVAPAALVLAAGLLGGALPAGYRLLALLDTPTGQGALGVGAPLARAYLSPWSPPGLSGLLTLADPGVWFRSGALLLATVATLALVGRLRVGQPGAVLLVVGTWLVPLVVLNPLLAPLALDRWSYLVAKTATLLRPLPYLGAAWGLTALGVSRRAGWLGSAAPAVAALVVVGAVASEAPRVAATTFGPADPQQHSVAASRAGDLRQRWAGLLAALDALPGRVVLLADPDTSYALAGLTRHWVVAVPHSHSPAQLEARDGALRRGDAVDALYQGAERAAEVLERYGATHVVAGERFGAALGDLPYLVRVGAGSTWQLYAYDGLRLGQALDVAATPVGDGVQAGVLRALVPAGRVVWVRVVGAPDGSRLELRHGAMALAERALPAMRDVVVGLAVPRDAPAGPALVGLVWPAGSRDLATVTLGREVEAELLAGLSPDRDYDYAAVAGWASYTMSFFSRQRAATTAQVSGRLRGALPGLPPGDYLLRLRVYDYGTGRANALRVRIGGAATTVRWEGTTAGTRWIEATIPAVRGTDVEVDVLEVGQGRVVLDVLALYPR
ncbi:MAG: hypothetical protein HYU88_09135 [Chloroflexi bacterium]|nr:hypothetical protein [Chloroflexota bacterium]